MITDRSTAPRCVCRVAESWSLGWVRSSNLAKLPCQALCQECQDICSNRQTTSYCSVSQRLQVVSRRKDIVTDTYNWSQRLTVVYVILKDSTSRKDHTITEKNKAGTKRSIRLISIVIVTTTPPRKNVYHILIARIFREHGVDDILLKECSGGSRHQSGVVGS